MQKVLGVGNSPVDVSVEVSEEILVKYGLNKKDFNMLSADAFVALSEDVGAGPLGSGGSVANTIWTMAQLGSDVSFMTRVGNDPSGQHFCADWKSSGVCSPEPISGLSTMEIFCLITPDGERTFASQGVTAPLAAEDVSEEMVEQSDWVLIEGFLMIDQAEAVAQAIALARNHNKKIALTLSAPFVLNLAFDTIASAIYKGVDLLVANDEELNALMQMAEGYDKGREEADRLMQHLERTPFLVTHGPRGASYTCGKFSVFEDSKEVDSVVDATGAGDAFLAGFLHEFLRNGEDLNAALREGHRLGSAVIQCLGGRLVEMPSKRDAA